MNSETVRTQKRQYNPHMGQIHPLRILVAEDNEVNQKLAVCFLKRLGYTADVAVNGVEAVRALRNRTYDLILMDIQMPELDGIGATGYIRKHWPAEVQPRIVALTAQSVIGDRDVCLTAGMDDYIAKPFQLEQLADALYRCPSKQRVPA